MMRASFMPLLLFGASLLLAVDGYCTDVATNVEITFQAEDIIDTSSYTSFERVIVEFLNDRINKTSILRVTVRSQALLSEEELAVELDILSSVNDSSYNVGNGILTTVSVHSNALDKAFQRRSLDLELGPIVSVQGGDTTASPIYSNDNPTHSPTSAPTPIFPTLPPESMAPTTKSPRVLPTSQPTTKAPVMTAAPTAFPVTTVPPTPAPITKAPVTTTAPTPAPVTKAPVTTTAPTPAPITSAPATTTAPTPDPVTNAPVTTTAPTPAPFTKAPVTTTAPTPAPITSAPVTTTAPTPDPFTNAPVTTTAPTPAPFTKAPVTTTAPTPAPFTKAPVTTTAPTPDPITKAPVITTAPTPDPVTNAQTKAPQLTYAPTPNPTEKGAAVKEEAIAESDVPTPATSSAPSTVLWIKSPSPAPITKAPTNTQAPTPVTEAPAILLTKAPTLSPTLALFTKAPALLFTKAPTSISPTPSTQAPTKAPQVTYTPNPSPTEKGGAVKEEAVLPSGPPSVVPTAAISLSPSLSTTQTKSSLVFKSYQIVITVKLFGLFQTIPLDEVNAVEQLTQDFIQETMPAVKSVIMEVSNVILSKQALTSDSLLRRSSQTDGGSMITLLTFGVDGKGRSKHEEILDTLHFDDLARHGFLTRYDEYIARLQASSGAFMDLQPADDDEPPILTNPASSISDNSNRSTVLVSVLAASFGAALLAGIFCTAMVFGLRRSDTDNETESVSNNSAHGSLHVEYSPPDSLFDDCIPRVISPALRKYPTQEQRRNFAPLSEAFECCSSLQSPSVSIIDVDQWSLPSNNNSFNNNKSQALTSMMHGSSFDPIAVSFSMEVLDEFEANIGSISPELMARRRLFGEEEI